VADDDDGAVCVSVILHTPAWSAAYNAPGSPEAAAFVAVVERRDGLELEPVLVPRQLLGTFIASHAPALVAIRSAPDEDIAILQELVELATAGGAVH
jgi:hypothetical protein